MCSSRPVASSMHRSTRRSTRASRPQCLAISSSNPRPRLRRSLLSVAHDLAPSDLMRTSSPGCRSVCPVGVFVSVPLTKPHRRPSRNHSRRGRTRVLSAWKRLNSPTRKARSTARTPTLPERTSRDVLAEVAERQRAPGPPGAARSPGTRTAPRRSTRRLPATWRAGPRSVSRGGRVAALATRSPVGGRVDPPEPGLLPVDEARGLATAVRLPVAAHAGQVHRVAHPPHAGRGHRVAQLVGDLVRR